MRIELSRAQTSQLMTWLAPLVEAEVQAGIEPSGYTLEVDIGNAVHGYPARAVRSPACRLELGEVTVSIDPLQPNSGQQS